MSVDFSDVKMVRWRITFEWQRFCAVFCLLWHESRLPLWADCSCGVLSVCCWGGCQLLWLAECVLLRRMSVMVQCSDRRQSTTFEYFFGVCRLLKGRGLHCIIQIVSQGDETLRRISCITGSWLWIFNQHLWEKFENDAEWLWSHGNKWYVIVRCLFRKHLVLHVLVEFVIWLQISILSNICLAVEALNWFLQQFFIFSAYLIVTSGKIMDVMWSVWFVLSVTVCEQVYCKGSQQISLKCGIVIGWRVYQLEEPINVRWWPVPDVDCGSLFQFPHHCRIGDLLPVLAVLWTEWIGACGASILTPMVFTRLRHFRCPCHLYTHLYGIHSTSVHERLQSHHSTTALWLPWLA